MLNEDWNKLDCYIYHVKCHKKNPVYEDKAVNIVSIEEKCVEVRKIPKESKYWMHEKIWCLKGHLWLLVFQGLGPHKEEKYLHLSLTVLPPPRP